jgi:hypothetical protein
VFFIDNRQVAVGVSFVVAGKNGLEYADFLADICLNFS